MKKNKMQTKPQSMSLPSVERDSDGVPVAWQLAIAGDNFMTIEGQSLTLALSADDIAGIVNYHQTKNEKIPLDSRHFLFHLASKHGVDESAIVNLLPSGTGTFGFGSLQQRGNDLWLSDVEYVPLARKLMKEGVFRYFSPVFRGLVDAPLRVTSVALENEPAINNLDQIAAADSSDNLTIDNLTQTLDALAASANASSNPKTENSKMNKLLTAIAAMLGMDAIALGADNDVPDDIVTKIQAAAADLGSGKSFATGIRDSLSLAADADHETVMAALKGLQAKSDSYDGLKTQVDALALAAENSKRDDLVKQGMAAGKLSQAMVDNWVNKTDNPVDSVALAAFLDNAPVVVPVGNLDHGKLPKTDTVALTAEDREVCATMGIAEDDFLKTKKGE